MGTETRIGIVAGLLIVVVASVYFYYGQSRPDQELLVSANPAIAPPPKIPQGKVTPTGGAAVHKTEPIAAATPKRLGVTANPSHSTPPVINKPVSAAKSQPIVTPQPMATAVQPPKPTPAAPVFRPAAPLVKQPVDINADPADSGDDLAESSWDHLAKPRAEESKIGGYPAGAPTWNSKSSPIIPPAKHEPATLAMGSSHTTPNKSSTHELAKPVTPAHAVTQTWPRKHTVSGGDTLSGISFQYYDDHAHVDQIVAANPQLKNPKALKIGDVLTIPEPKQRIADLNFPNESNALARTDAKDSTMIPLAGRASPTDNKTPPIEKSDKPEKSAKLSPEKSTPAADKSNAKLVTEKSSPGEQTYTTQDGDTFYSLAKKFYRDGRKWQKIYDVNKSVVKNDPRRLKKGMVLHIPKQ